MHSPISNPIRNLIGLCLFSMAASASAAGEDAKTAREHELLHRAQQQLQQAQQDNADLTRAKNDAEAKVKELQGKLDAASRDAKNAEARNASLNGELKKTQGAQTDLAAKLDDTSKQLADMTKKQGETATTLASREADLEKTSAALEQSKSAHASCEAKNEKLYDYGQTLLQKYQHKGVWDALKQKEPVTGIGEVQVENVVQEYRDKLATQRIEKGN